MYTYIHMGITSQGGLKINVSIWSFSDLWDNKYLNSKSMFYISKPPFPIFLYYHSRILASEQDDGVNAVLTSSSNRIKMTTYRTISLESYTWSLDEEKSITKNMKKPHGDWWQKHMCEMSWPHSHVRQLRTHGIFQW